MRYELRHPRNQGLVAVYGWDRNLSWWVEVRDRERLQVSYDALDPGDTSPRGVIDVLVEHDFLTTDSLNRAATALQDTFVEDIRDPMTTRAAEVIVNLKKAGE